MRQITRIVVDPDLCVASSNCVHIAPAVFQLNEDNVSSVVDPEGASEETIFEAARACPTEAIRLYDAEGRQIYPEP